MRRDDDTFARVIAVLEEVSELRGMMSDDDNDDMG